MSEYQPEVPVEPVAEEAPEEVWSGPSQDEWGEVAETMDMLRQAIQQPEPQYQQPQQQQPSFDGRDPEDFLTVGEAQQLLQQLEQTRIAPLSAYAEQQAMGEATERAKDVLQSIQTEKGEFLNPASVDRAIARSNDFYAEFAAKFNPYGNNPAGGHRAAEAALERAYQEQKAFEEAVGKAYHDQQVNQIRGLSGAPRMPGVSGQPGQHVSIPEGGNEFDLVASYFQGNRGPA